MSRPFKPTPYQVGLLAAIARGERTMPPDGYREAGPDAARWWRSTEILCKRGLLFRHADRVTVSLPKEEALPEGDFEEKVRGKTPAYTRAEHLRNLGRRAIVVHRSGPHFAVRVSAKE